MKKLEEFDGTRFTFIFNFNRIYFIILAVQAFIAVFTMEFFELRCVMTYFMTACTPIVHFIMVFLSVLFAIL